MRASRNNARNAWENCECANLNRHARRSEGRTKTKVALFKHHAMKA